MHENHRSRFAHAIIAGSSLVHNNVSSAEDGCAQRANTAAIGNSMVAECMYVNIAMFAMVSSQSSCLAFGSAVLARSALAVVSFCLRDDLRLIEPRTAS